jgi:hypothetical protein
MAHFIAHIAASSRIRANTMARVKDDAMMQGEHDRTRVFTGKLLASRAPLHLAHWPPPWVVRKRTSALKQEDRLHVQPRFHKECWDPYWRS